MKTKIYTLSPTSRTSMACIAAIFVASAAIIMQSCEGSLYALVIMLYGLVHIEIKEES